MPRVGDPLGVWPGAPGAGFAPMALDFSSIVE